MKRLLLLAIILVALAASTCAFAEEIMIATTSDVAYDFSADATASASATVDMMTLVSKADQELGLVGCSAKEIVRRANLRTKVRLTQSEISMLKKLYGHHQETYDMAYELAEHGVIHPNQCKAWSGRVISLAYQIYTICGQRLIAVVDELLKCLARLPKPQSVIVQQPAPVVNNYTTNISYNCVPQVYGSAQVGGAYAPVISSNTLGSVGFVRSNDINISLNNSTKINNVNNNSNANTNVNNNVINVGDGKASGNASGKSVAQ